MKKFKDKNLSKDGWYIASYIVRFKILSEDDSNENKRCTAWENTIIIKADNPEEAYEKAINEANIATDPYENTDGEKVQFVFEGLTSLLPIYDKLEDGAEILWVEHENKAIKTIRSRVKTKEELEVFAEE